MLLKKYGPCRIEVDGEQFTVLPCFANMAEIGTPKEIVEAIKKVGKLDHISIKWCFDIVQACCDKTLPNFLKPTFEMNRAGQLICSMPEWALNDLITLAYHCIKHGIIGDVEPSSGAKVEPLTEFDAYEYIDLAASHFNMSYDEAAKMTMTQFVRRMRTEYPERHKALNSESKEIDGKTYDKFSLAAEAANKAVKNV